MHGAFNEADRGEIHRYIIGRMAMQFRQWMPAFYMARFGKERINVLSGQTEEGFYRTYYGFIYGTLKDAVHLKFELGKRYGALSDAQKANIWKGLMEASTALGLTFMLNYGSLGDPDKDDPGFVNMAKYNLYRLKMELGSATPLSIDFKDNVFTLIKSPIPAMENIDGIISLLYLNQLTETIETGKYAGWNRYLRNAYFTVPGARNIGRYVSLVTEGDISMFNPYTKNSN